MRDSLEQAGHTPDTWIAWMEYLQQTNQREQGVKDLERLKKELPANRQALKMDEVREYFRLFNREALLEEILK